MFSPRHLEFNTDLPILGKLGRGKREGAVVGNFSYSSGRSGDNGLIERVKEKNECEMKKGGGVDWGGVG